jgi:hypothetical protein
MTEIFNSDICRRYGHAIHGSHRLRLHWLADIGFRKMLQFGRPETFARSITIKRFLWLSM